MKTTNNVATGHGITLNSDNAKKFATRLKKTLKEENIDFKTSKCYDILAKTFGSSNWHELSQHLSSNNTNSNHTSLTKDSDINEVVVQNSSKLNSIFDLPWVEFKYMVSKMTDYLGFDFHTQEFLDIVLDILHTNQPKSEIYWDKINEFLDGDKNFRNVEGVPIHSYSAYLNPTLNEDEVKSFVNRVFKCGGSGYDYRPKFSPEKIESFFYMLRFIKEENFILRDKHTTFISSEVLEYENGRYKSEHEFIGVLIRLADLNNECINYNKNAFRTLSFHDLLIQLFSRTTMLHHISIESDKLLPKYTKYVAEELFKNHNFISYLCTNMKKYIHNTINISVKENIFDDDNRSPIKECTNYINYTFNFFPHPLIFKHEIENLDLSNFANLFIEANTNELIGNKIRIWVEMEVNKNKDNHYLKSSKKFLDIIHEENFLSLENNISISFSH